MPEEAGTGLLRAVVVIDYQNIHLTGRDVFRQGQPAGTCVVDPIQFAIVGIERRNALQREGYPSAELAGIQVFRGQPSPTHDPVLASAAMRQRDVWSKHPLATITYRPLNYKIRNGTLVGVEEKGIDVLCALALVEGVQHPNYDVVILASHDTDLIPALQLGFHRGTVETLGWRGAKRLRPEHGSIWDTRLDYDDYLRCLDPKDYFPKK